MNPIQTWRRDGLHVRVSRNRDNDLGLTQRIDRTNRDPGPGPANAKMLFGLIWPQSQSAFSPLPPPPSPWRLQSGTSGSPGLVSSAAAAQPIKPALEGLCCPLSPFRVAPHPHTHFRKDSETNKQRSLSLLVSRLACF